MDEDSRKAASDILKEVERYGERDTVTLFELKTVLHDRGFGVFMLLLALPLAVPLPTIPVHTPIFALPLTLFSIQLVMGHSTPWLPYFLDKKSFKREFLTSVVKKTSPLLKVMERWTKPRAMFIFSRMGRMVVGLTCLLCALSIAIPLPFTNAIPAIGICAIALGMLNRDGVLVVIGIVIGLLGLLTTTMILVIGPKLIMETLSLVSKLFVNVSGLSSYSTMAASVSLLMAMYLFILIVAFSRIRTAANLTSNKAVNLAIADFALSHNFKLSLQNSIEGQTGKYIDDAATLPHYLPSHGLSDVFTSRTEGAEHVHFDKPYQADDDIRFEDKSTYLADVHVASAAHEGCHTHQEEAAVSRSHINR